MRAALTLSHPGTPPQFVFSRIRQTQVGTPCARMRTTPARPTARASPTSVSTEVCESWISTTRSVKADARSIKQAQQKRGLESLTAGHLHRAERQAFSVGKESSRRCSGPKSVGNDDDRKRSPMTSHPMKSRSELIVTGPRRASLRFATADLPMQVPSTQAEAAAEWNQKPRRFDLPRRTPTREGPLSLASQPWWRPRARFPAAYPACTSLSRGSSLRRTRSRWRWAAL